jgi:hypothetical protein
MYGNQLTQPNEVLRKINVESLYKEIVQPQGKLFDQIKQLRSVKLMDEKQYKKLKVILPYFVCGVFSPNIRKKEHFAYTDHFVVDIDNINRNQQDIVLIKNQLKQDDNVALMFTSPGNDGLKIVFELAKRINDANYFTYFYKQFCIKLAEQYQLHGLIDIKTNDVSRCCFLSFDDGAYFNPLPSGVNPDQYVQSYNLDDIFEVKKAEKVYEKKIETLTKEGTLVVVETNPLTALSDDVLERIKSRINPQFKAKVTKDYFIPPELDEAWGTIEAKLNEAEMYVETNRKISYGRQVKIKAGRHWCEMNIFYGKKGFTVVKTTKTGSNEDLAKMCQQYLQEFLM